MEDGRSIKIKMEGGKKNRRKMEQKCGEGQGIM